MGVKNEIIFSSGGRIRDILSLIKEDEFERLEEIRFRAGKASFVKTENIEYMLKKDGTFSKEFIMSGECFIPNVFDIKSFIQVLSGYSLYAFSEEIKNGYITVEGGHRIGITGKTMVKDGKVVSISDFSGINIRISHQIKGCGEKLKQYILKDGLCENTMIISPPGLGKTTLLRDIIRILSENGKNVSVADERGEISGLWRGVCSNDIGPRTDVLGDCPKSEGMIMLLRSMSPDVIAVDEIGSSKDAVAVETIMLSGVSVICTIHGRDINNILSRTGVEEIKKTGFTRFIELRAKTGHVEAFIKNENGNLIGSEVIR